MLSEIRHLVRGSVLGSAPWACLRAWGEKSSAHKALEVVDC